MKGNYGISAKGCEVHAMLYMQHMTYQLEGRYSIKN